MRAAVAGSAIKSVLLCALVTRAGGQTLVRTPCAEFETLLAKSTGNMDAYVILVRPRITYAFRFYAGYSVQVPFAAFAGDRSPVRVLTKVLPEQGERMPICLAQTATPQFLPRGPLGNEVVVEGGFFTGPGDYAMDLAIVSESGLTCHKHFRLHAELKRSEKQLARMLKPGAVESALELRWDRVARQPGPPRHATILLHIANLLGPRTTLEMPEAYSMLSLVATLLAQSPFDEVRLVAFNLDQQQEIFRTDNLDGKSFKSLLEAVLAVRLTTVSADRLAPPKQALAFLDSLVRAEFAVSAPADTVLFVGPYIPDELKWPGAPCETGHRTPALYYFQRRVNRGDMEYDTFVRDLPVLVRGNEFSDPIEKMVKGCSGEVYRIHTPAELADAIRRMGAETVAAERQHRP